MEKAQKREQVLQPLRDIKSTKTRIWDGGRDSEFYTHYYIPAATNYKIVL